MYIKLMDGTEIDLPSELNLQERITLCEKIINENEQSFKYVMTKNNTDINYVGTQAERRLELLGTYILKATQNDRERPIITEYKEKRIKNNEEFIDF